MLKSRTLGSVAAVGLCLLLPAAAAADRSFTPRFSVNDTGDITMVSNTLMTCPTSSTCTRARAADPTLSDSNLQNNAYAMTYVDVDGDPTTFNSSTSNLNLPAGSTVLFAGLYWAGDTSGSGSNSAPNAADRDEVRFRPPGAAAYQTITATTLDTGSPTTRYQGFADVTSLVAAAGNGTYTVGNVQAGQGADHYAGWTLVIAYRNPAEPARNLTVFDGLRSVSGTTGQTIPVSGFLTPPSGPVNTKIGIVAYEGDLGIPGDSANLNGTTLSDSQNPANNFFNSSISNTGSRVTTKNVDYPNQLGYDADIVNANGILGNNATSANIGLTTSGDVYIPGVVTFATELFAPKIVQTKTIVDVNGGTVEHGDILEYRINGTNTGQDGAVSFVLRDPIPANTTYVAGSLQTANPGTLANRTDASGDDVAEFDSLNNRVVGRLGIGATASAGGRIAPGATYEMRFRVRANSALPQGTAINNTATANFFSQSLNTPLTVSSSANTTVNAPDLAITKTRNGGPFVPGGSGSYNLAVGNVGVASLQGGLATAPTTTVTDTLPADLTPTSASGAGWTCNVVAQTVTCTRATNLAPGASFPPITINVDVDPGATPPIVNEARVSNPVDTNPANDTSIDPSPVNPSADLSIAKTVSSPTVAVGQNVTYTLTVENGGPSLSRNTAVTDTLPNGLTLVSVTPSQGSCSNVIDCDLGDLAPGATATVTIVATATVAGAGQTVTNSAAVDGDQPDPDPTDNEDGVPLDIGGVDLEIEKTIDDATPTAGQTISYTLVVGNNGPSDGTGIQVHDELPASLNAVSTNRSECVVTAPRTIDCAFPTLASGDTETIVVTATVPASQPAGGLDNTASVSGAEPDTDPTNNTDTVTAVVDQGADLSITKTADVNPVSAGELLTYTLTIHNDGPSNASGVEIIDDLPAGVTFDSASPGCTFAAGTVTCAVGALAAGGDAVRTVTVRVDDATTGTLVNNAEVTSTTPDPDPTDNETTTTTDVESGADLEIDKSASPANPAPGATVTYTLTVTNNGPQDADDVVVSDALPAGVTFVSSTPGAPDCGFAAGTVSCDLGTVPSGATRTITVQATVDPVTLPPDHQHAIPIEKVEQQVDLEVGETETIVLSCPTGMIMVDGSIRVDHVDQDTGTLPDVQYSRQQSASLGSYEFIVTNTAGGRAQAKVFGTCMASQTALEAGHQHDIVVSDPPVTASAPLGIGRHEIVLSCGPGRTAVAPGIDASGGNARLVGSEPLPDGGRRIVVEVEDDTTLVTASIRCLLNQVGTTDGHSHPLVLEEVVRQVTVPANSVVSETVTCPVGSKGIVASYDLPAGLILLGHDPQPVSRVFRLMNPTGAPITADLDLLCVGDRTGGAILANQIVNSATVSSSTLDPDTANNVGSASLTVASGPGPGPGPGPVPPGPDTPPPGPDGGVASLDSGSAKLGGSSVAIPVVCEGADCTGSLTLRAVKSNGGIDKGDRLGKGAFTIDAGTASVEVPLRKAAAKLAAKGKLRKVKAVLRGANGSEARVFKLG